jgi:tRNA-dihydrouridine synthase B
MNNSSIQVGPYSALRIGSVTVDPPLILAPMAGITNRAFRLMVQEAGGCGMVSTEMISAYALRYRHRQTRDMLDWSESEHPISVQIFGAHPETVAEGAKIIEQAGADIIEVNLGCPAPKVTKTGAGAALLKDLRAAESVIEAVVRAVKVPVTVKTRKGWDSAIQTALAVALLAERCGASAITIHGRTVAQGYSGKADWDVIRRVKESVAIPVIGNGDIRSPEDARRMFDETGCDGVMIGRGVLGDPWLFSRVSALLSAQELLREPSFDSRIEAAKKHARLLVELLGEDRAVREMRGHIAWYAKGVPGAASVRSRIMKAHSLSDIEGILDEARSQC